MDIVERLKAKPPKGFVTSPLMIDAADEIERLRQQNAELVEALGWFVVDDRFVVSVGGNPLAVEPMIRKSKSIYNKATGGE